MGYNCCVPQCHSDSKKRVQGVKFHKFPNNKELLTLWTAKIRTGKSPSRHSKVCSRHFTEDDYITTANGQWKNLLPVAVPSLHLPVRTHDRLRKKEVADRLNRYHDRQTRIEALHLNIPVQNPPIAHLEPAVTDEVPEQVIPAVTDEVPEQVIPVVMEQATPMTRAISSQTFLHMHDQQFVAFEILTNEQLQYFSGFEIERFECLFEFASKGVGSFPISSCSIKDQLLITLCKYRHNLDYKMIDFMFHVSRKIVSKVFLFWTDRIYHALKSVDFWSLGNQDPDKYTAIIDCTEIPIQKSENPAMHQMTYSQYKNRPTFKCLVAIDEVGSVIFCSDIYGGSTSDRQIVLLSKFVDLLKDGDTVLADRGFEISDLLEKKGVALNIPPFLRGKKQLSETEVMVTRKLANRRIHVERLIGLSKLNAILNEPMGSYLWPAANKIVYNCTLLCNFKQRIVNSLPKRLKRKHVNLAK